MVTITFIIRIIWDWRVDPVSFTIPLHVHPVIGPAAHQLEVEAGAIESKTLA